MQATVNRICMLLLTIGMYWSVTQQCGSAFEGQYGVRQRIQGNLQEA